LAGELEPPVCASFKNGPQHHNGFCLSSFQVWRLGEHFRTMIVIVGFGFVKTNQKIDPKYSDLSKVFNYHVFCLIYKDKSMWNLSNAKLNDH
jgi:hypothetical protein